MLRNEAVRLFVERPQAAQPHFNLTAGNAPAIAAISTRLDGVPLALELAAERVKVLSAEQIAARLADRFRLLVGGSRTALPRQQTLQALIDWSYDLLPEDEGLLLRQMSVFAGGCTLEAAEVVGEGLDVLDLMTQLVNKSLINGEEHGAEARYHLLETIRQYARDKLLEAGEAENVRKRHLNFYLHLTESVEPKLTGPEMISCLDQLEVEQDNLRTALEWALDKDPVAALRLVAALNFFWSRRSSVSEGLKWVKSALARAEAMPEARGEATQSYLTVKARTLTSEAVLALNLGDNLAALAALEASISLARQIDAPRTLAYALGMGATVLGFLGDLATALVWAEESIALSRQHNYVFELGLISGSYMFVAVVADQSVPPGAQEELLQAARATGNPWVIAMAVWNVGRVATMHGNLIEAFARFEEAATLLQQIRDQPFYNSSQSEIGHVFRIQGRYPEALTMYHETIRIWQELGQQPAVAHELECFAFIAVAMGQNERAAKLFGAAEALRELTGSNMAPSEPLEYDRAVLQLRAQNDEAAWAAGRALSMEQATQFALVDDHLGSDIKRP